MDTVVVTILCPPEGPFDVQLPLEMTLVEVVAELLAGRVLSLDHSPAWPAAAQNEPAFSARLAATNRLLANDRPLREADLLDGDVLEIQPGLASAAPPPVRLPVGVRQASLQAAATGELFACADMSNSIGRDRADIAIGYLPHGRLVSARHARIYHRRQQWWLEDSASRNGTLLNGVPLRPGRPAPLQHGAQIRFGGAIGPLLTFLLPGQP